MVDLETRDELSFRAAKLCSSLWRKENLLETTMIRSYNDDLRERTSLTTRNVCYQMIITE